MQDMELYLDALNEPQREAVLENSAPLLVLAGAGSGKTRVITTKVAYCVKELGIAPWQILAVTFTNKAAQEMRQRIQVMLPEVDISDTNIRTFHSFGAWLLRRHGERIGLNPNFTIYDDDDSLSLLASCYPDHKKKELDPIMRAISRAKDMGLTPDDDLSDFKVDQRFAQMFQAYENKLRRVGNVDFADLITRSIELLDSCPDVQQWVHHRFKIVLVDEYQDSNVAQFNLLKLLVGPSSFICVVGDDDQSIYRFRGAEVQNILSFPDVYPGTKIIKLEQNYRSTSSILAVASEVIAHNKGRHPKTLWTENGKGTPPRLIYVEDDRAEAEQVAHIMKADGRYDDSAVLYRTNAQSVAFETCFSRLSIPYKVVGALRFYEREEVKDAIALIYLELNPGDEVNWRRMVNKPPRGIGDGAQDKILAHATTTDGNIIEAMRKAVASGELSGKAVNGAKDFLRVYDEATKRLDSGENADFAEYLIRESGLLELHQKSDELNKTARTENLEALVSAIAQYPSGREGVGAFLEEAQLDPTTLGREDPSEKPGVTLITMHNTKGLEFDRVFIAGLEEGLFPGRARESDEDMEEERRIFYVSVTRARKELYLLSAKRRMIWGHTNYQLPSRFIDEIPQDLLTIQGIRPGSGLFGGWGGGSRENGLDGYAGYGSLGEKRARTSIRYGEDGEASWRKHGSDDYWAGGGRKKGVPSNLIVSNPTKPAGAKSVLLKKGLNGVPVPPPKSAKELAASEEHPMADDAQHFPLGQRVYSDSYGAGEVVQVKDRNGKEIIDVRFDSGRKATFISRYASLEKIGND